MPDSGLRFDWMGTDDVVIGVLQIKYVLACTEYATRTNGGNDRFDKLVKSLVLSISSYRKDRFISIRVRGDNRNVHVRPAT